MSEAWALRLFRWIYVAFILQASLKTALEAWRGVGAGHHAAHVVLALASIESLAALAFLIEPLDTVAGAALLAVFATAATLSVGAGDFLPLRFAYYAATAISIVWTRRQLGPRAVHSAPAGLTS